MKMYLKTAQAKEGLYFAFAKEGRKLWVNAPSAKILLKRLGNLKATKNMSEYMFAPSMDALNKSLKNPKIRELKIPKKFINIDFIINVIVSKRY